MDSQSGAHFPQGRIDRILLVDTVVLHFQEEIARTEQLLVKRAASCA
jgi:hypothetical protein